MALAQTELGIGRRVGRHGGPPGRGRVHAAGDRPVGRRRGRSAEPSCPSSTCTTPTTAGGRGPSRARYDRDWLARYRAAQVERVARIDAVAKAALADSEDARARAGRRRQGRRSAPLARPADPGRGHARTSPSTAPSPTRPTSTSRSIPTNARSAALFAFPDPLDANYGRGGLARTMTARGWLSTWSGLSSRAKLADTMPHVRVPTLLVHPTADTEIRVRQADEIVANAGARGRDLRRDEGRPALPGGPPAPGPDPRGRVDGRPVPVVRQAQTAKASIIARTSPSG